MPSNALEFNVTDVNIEQPENAYSPMLVTLLGIVMEVKPEQPEKAEPPILLTLLGIVTEVRPEQRENADCPMLVTLLGIVTEVRPEQPEKAELPMLVTPSFMITLTIDILYEFQGLSLIEKKSFILPVPEIVRILSCSVQVRFWPQVPL